MTPWLQVRKRGCKAMQGNQDQSSCCTFNLQNNRVTVAADLYAQCQVVMMTLSPKGAGGDGLGTAQPRAPRTPRNLCARVIVMLPELFPELGRPTHALGKSRNGVCVSTRGLAPGVA
eukprot:1146482-Pelagomonas_calceolata.AAC.6